MTHDQTLSTLIFTRADSIITISKTSDTSIVISASYDQTVTEQTIDTLVSSFTKALITISKNATATETGLTTAYNQSVSLLINQSLVSLGYILLLGRIGNAIVISTRVDSLPVIFYVRPDSLPVIFSSGDTGIDRLVNRINRVRSYYNMDTEEKQPVIASTKQLSKVTMDKTTDETETVTTSYTYTVA